MNLRSEPKAKAIRALLTSMHQPLTFSTTGVTVRSLHFTIDKDGGIQVSVGSLH